MENSNGGAGQDQNEKLPVEFKADEVREQVVKSYGLTEEDNKDLIDKIVGDKQEEHKKLSTAIGQKIDWREKATKAEKAKADAAGDPNKPPVKDPVEIDTLIDQRLEKRDLEQLELSDEVKKEVQAYAKLHNISIKKALTSDYITYVKEKEDKKANIDNASMGAGRKSTTKKDYSQMKPSDFNLQTPEGLADYKAYTEYLKSQG